MSFDLRGTMSEERQAEVAHALGMDAIPIPAYDDLPEAHDGAVAQQKFNHMKAMQLVDVLASHVFMGQFMPSSIPIDQAMNARDFKRGWSQAVCIDTSLPIPVNEKITAATGITAIPCERNWYGWLAQNVEWAFKESGARAMSPVLIVRSRGERRFGQWLSRPMISAHYKLDRTPRDGMREEDMMASVGLLHSQQVRQDNRVLPIGLDSRVVEEDKHDAL
jgi:hypothetical protein